MASAVLEADGLHRVSYETLIENGVAIVQVDPAEIRVPVVDGSEVAAFVTAYGDAMGPGDEILFHVSAGADRVEIRTGDGAARMDWTYAAPVAGEGDVWYGVAHTDNTLAFATDLQYQRYVLMDFSTQPIWLLDVSDPVQPIILYGAAEVVGASGIATYLSYIPATDEPAACIAVDDSAVIEIQMLE